MILKTLVEDYGNHPITEPERFYSKYDPPYHVQPKLDGMRVFLVRVGDRCLAVNRRGYYFDYRVDVEEGVYDGEMMGFSPFNKTGVKLVLFDLVVEDLSLSERLRLLRERVRPSSRLEVIEDVVAWSREEVEALAKRYMERGFEGVVVKADVEYYAKDSWLKIKRRETLDMVIVAVKKTKSLLEYGIPESFRVRLGDLETDVASGLSKGDKARLLRLLKPIGEDDHYIYVKPEILLEIEFQEKSENGLRHPRILRVRVDKPPSV